MPAASFSLRFPPHRLLANGALHILLAVLCGALLGWLDPALALRMKPLSDLFLRVVGWLMPFILFVLVASGVAGVQRQRQGGHMVGRIVLYFQSMGVLALLCGALFSIWLAPGRRERRIDAVDVPLATPDLQALMSDIASALGHSLVLQVVLAAILFGGFAGRSQRWREPLHDALEKAVRGLFRVLRVILRCAPLAAFGAVAFTISKYGLASAWPLLRFVAVLYLASLVFVVLVFGALLRMAGGSLWRLLGYLKEELLLVASTGSSVAALPGFVDKLERLGCARTLTRLVLTTGYTFNLNGSNLYLSCALLFLAQQADLQLGAVQVSVLLLTALLTSLGSTSVAGSAFFTLIATLHVLNLIPLEQVGLLLGVERLMKCRSLTNVIGNCVACLTIAAWQGLLDRQALRRELGLDRDEAHPE